MICYVKGATPHGAAPLLSRHPDTTSFPQRHAPRYPVPMHSHCGNKTGARPHCNAPMQLAIRFSISSPSPQTGLVSPRRKEIRNESTRISGARERRRFEGIPPRGNVGMGGTATFIPAPAASCTGRRPSSRPPFCRVRSCARPEHAVAGRFSAPPPPLLRYTGASDLAPRQS